jgi:hypothetical protein
LYRIIKDADFSKLPSDVFDEPEKIVLKKRLLRNLRKAKTLPLPYRAFSGKYDKDAVRKYDAIEEALKRGDIITADTFAYKPENLVSRNLGLNAEQIDNGIVQSHAYSVLGVETRGYVRYVKLRNPWGDGTASYTRKPGRKKVKSALSHGSNEGMFLMEFNDFLAAFGKVAVD